MKVKILPSKAQGEVSAPPSKSLSHRALICSALTSGSTVKNIYYSDDINATLNCLEALGAVITKNADTVHIGGLDPFNIPDGAILNCNESASTLRFLLPLCMLGGKSVTFKGSKRLIERGADIYRDIANKNNITWEQNDNTITVCGKLKSGKYSIVGNVSSQYISGLLFALPILNEDSTLEITGKTESAPYIELSLAVLKAFGVSIGRENEDFYIKSAQCYKSNEYTVEGDFSNCAFLDALNLLGGNVTIAGLPKYTLQGDSVYKDIFTQLKQGKKDFDLSSCPDLAPIMLAMASVYSGARFTGTSRLKIKESDRALCMAQELKKLGIDVTVEENSITVHSGTLHSPNIELDSHNDHRIVMALSVLCTKTGGIIKGAQAVSKSFPDFFDKLKLLGIQITEV